MKQTGSPLVTDFLADLKHPLIKEIEQIRAIVLKSNKELTENIKWNAPNFCFKEEDRITMRIHPPKHIQLIFHRGAKIQTLPSQNLIVDETGILVWKATDRAVATFVNMDDIELKKKNLIEIVNNWLDATKTPIS